jgi:hypothetical protein
VLGIVFNFFGVRTLYPVERDPLTTFGFVVFYPLAVKIFGAQKSTYLCDEETYVE